MVRPRFAAGTRDVVEGYSVALHPRAVQAMTTAGSGAVEPGGETGGESRVVWFGGGKLGRDLTLPRLREQWADSAEHTAAAVMEWSTGAGTTPAVSGASGPRPRAVEWEQVHSEVGAMYDRLRSVPTNDTETWTRVARETAGVLSAWSEAVEDKPGPLADAARDLGRCAQVRANPGRPRRGRQPGLGRAAVLITQAVAGSRGPVSYAILAAQLIATVKALRDHQVMAGRVQSAALMEARVVQQLETIAAGLPKIGALDEAGMPPRLDEGVAASMAAAAASRGASPDAPLPARLRRPAPMVGVGDRPRVPGQSTGAGPRRGLEAPTRAARTPAKVQELPLATENAPRPFHGPQQGP